MSLERIYDDGERTSGWDESREEYQKARSRVQSGEIDAVVINDKRRLARDFDETMRLILDLREYGVEAHTFEEGSSTSLTRSRLPSKSSKQPANMRLKRRKLSAHARLSKSGWTKDTITVALQSDFDSITRANNGYPDRNGQFEIVLEAIHMVEAGSTYREVEDELDIAPATMRSSIMDRRDQYLNASKNG